MNCLTDRCRFTAVFPSGERERGAALVTTLLIVALITVTVTGMTTRQQLSIQKAQNRQIQTQLVNLASAGEQFAMAVLGRDRRDGERNNSDSTEDFWAESLPPVPVDGATVEGCVIDLNGKFNLNNLVNIEGNTDQLEYDALRRLLTALSIDPVKAEAILDWIDPNIDATGTDGAEDDFYTGQTPPYRAANGPMASPTELLLVKGFRVADEGGLDDYDTLLPHISALPTGTAININTASSAVLASLADYMIELSDELIVVDDGYWESYPECPEGGGLLDTAINSETGEEVESEQPVSEEAFADGADDGFIYENIQTFINQSRNPADENDNLENANISVSSNYFISRVTVTRDDVSMTQFTTLVRDNTGAITTLRRSRGGL